MPRRVVLLVEARAEPGTLLDVFTQKLGYRLLMFSRNEMVLEKGNKILTYIGFTNIDYVYRVLKITNVENKNDLKVYRFEYEFSWLTNIGYLPRIVYNELSGVSKVLNIVSTKMERRTSV